MSGAIHKITAYFAAHPRKLFLADALGALLTAILLWVLVRNFDVRYGLSSSVVSGLALIALLIFGYSFTCYLLIRTAWRPFINALAGINLLYCALTLTLICIHTGIKPLGIVYFTGELFIICLLVYIELRTAKLLKNSQPN